MPTLNPNSWSQRDRDALDRYITGNWGEGPHESDVDESSWIEDKDPVTEVYLQYREETGTFDLIELSSGEKLNEMSTRNYHDLVELATANGWEVVDNPHE